MLSLFTGAGGLDLGLEAAGFRAALCVESDKNARRTLQANRPDWKQSEPGDIHQLHPKEILQQARLSRGEVALVAAGPPCQPFSKSGYWSNGDSRRLGDPRASTLKAFLDVVEAALPQVILLENVKGLVFNGKDEGLRLIEESLSSLNRKKRTKYKLQLLHLNSADYGIPQSRERVFLIASIDGRLLKLPCATHGPSSERKPYSTAWDAIGHLDIQYPDDDLKPTGRWADLLPSIPEGRNYLWHTDRNKVHGGEPLFGWRTRYWSFMLKLAKNQPSWTIQAEPGPATGPFHWRSRLLSVQEICRLQTFPVDYQIEGDRRAAQRQLGNAVPCAVGELLGLEIKRQLLGCYARRNLTLIPAHREDCPPPEPPASVPRKFLRLRHKHTDHPGVGLGPGAQLRKQNEAKERDST